MAQTQSSYVETMPIGAVGMIANAELANTITRTLESSAGVAFGQPLFRGSGDHGCVIGGTFAATGTATAAAGNTGNGVMGAVTVSAGAKQGVYTLTITEPATNAGEFVVTDPDGLFVAKGDVASAFSAGGLAFTLADGSTDFNGGDVFTIAVVYTANAKLLGFAVRDSTVPANATTPDAYPQYYNVAIATRALMWVIAGATVTAGSDVYWDPSTGRYTSTVTHIRMGTYLFDTSAVNGGLVLVRLSPR